MKYFAVGGTIGRVQGGCTFTDLAVGSQSIVDATVTQAVTNLTVGGLVGVVYQNAVFRYSVASAALVKGKVISGSAFVGGAVGLCQAIQHIDSTTSNVSCSATETSKCYVGGVVGGLSIMTTLPLRASGCAHCHRLQWYIVRLTPPPLVTREASPAS